MVAFITGILLPVYLHLIRHQIQIIIFQSILISQGLYAIVFGIIPVLNARCADQYQLNIIFSAQFDHLLNIILVDGRDLCFLICLLHIVFQSRSCHFVLIPVTLVVIGPCIVDGSSKIIEHQTLPAIMIPENLKILFQLGLKNLFIGNLPIQGIRFKNDILRGLLFQSLGQKTLCIIKMLAAGSADITCIAVLTPDLHRCDRTVGLAVSHYQIIHRVVRFPKNTITLYRFHSCRFLIILRHKHLGQKHQNDHKDHTEQDKTQSCL